MTSPLLSMRDVHKTFPARRDLLGRVTSRVHAVDGASLEVAPGQTLGLVGESGSGKSTLGRLALRLIEPDSGMIELDGEDITGLKGADLRRVRHKMQMVFQDPQSSLDPNWVVGDIIAEPLRAQRRQITRAEREAAVRQLLDQVGLAQASISRYAYEFSGGQRQRIAIARALAVEPRLVVCDEPVSALDVSTQAQVLTLLEELQSRLGLAYLFIAHDLSVVQHIGDVIAVMYLGRIIETGPASTVYRSPRHPYTEALVSAIPHPDPAARKQRIVLEGEVPSPINPPSGCHFHARCAYVMDECRTVVPHLVTYGDVSVACHLHDRGPMLGGGTIVPVSIGPRTT